METVTRGYAVTAPLRYRSWRGILADVWEVEAEQGACGRYLSSHPRLFIVLEQGAPGALDISLPDPDRTQAPLNGRLSFIPAGVWVNSSVAQPTTLRHLDLHFDIPALVSRLPFDIDPNRLATPRLMFDDDKVSTLATLLAEECMAPERHDLYGESLGLALFTELFEVRSAPVRPTGQLSARRLRIATDYISSNSTRVIKLEEIARVVGLSQSYFCSAFKASTGMAPHQWQMKARIEVVKQQLAQKNINIASVAQATGFSDQAHMTRVFKQYAGVTPAAWLKSKHGQLVTKP